MALTLKMPRLFGGGNAEPVLSNDNAQLVATLHGKHYEDCLAGRVFSQISVQAGAAIPVITGTALAGGMPIWNPSNSKVNVELIRITIARTTGAAAGHAFYLMARNKVGTDVAGSSEITAFADTDPINGLLGSGQSSGVRSSNTGTVTVTAGVAGEMVRTFGATAREVDASTNQAHVLTEDLDGTVIVPPGNLVWIAASLATVALYAPTIVWKEVPV